MTITLRGTTSANNVSTGTSAGTISGLAAGDALFARGRSPLGAFTAKSGWTTISLQQNGDTGYYEYIAARIADGTSTDTFDPAWAGGGSSNLAVIAFQGTATLTLDSNNHNSNSNSTSFTAGTVTPTGNTAMYVLFTGDDSGSGGTPSLPSGFTDSAIDLGSAGSMICYKALSGQSGVGQNQAVTYSAASYGPGGALIIKEASASGAKQQMLLGVG